MEADPSGGLPGSLYGHLDPHCSLVTQTGYYILTAYEAHCPNGIKCTDSIQKRKGKQGRREDRGKEERKS